jgi:branched-chain amino acid transport system ATP-binding protein
MSALLEVRALSKRFGGVQAVADLSFMVGEGEILALIGPNGAGKSTVFNLINGIVAPDSGHVIFAGADITGKPTYEVAHHGIARAHQIVQPLAGLSVLDNCLVGACYGRDDLSMAAGREVVREVAELVGLAERIDMPAAALTTAGKKRLELARALCGRPRLLLLDEVLAGLNPTEIERMIEVIRAIRARGVSILIIEHVMRAIMSLSDRVVALNLGRHLAEGSPQEVANHPAVIEAYLGDPKLLVSADTAPTAAPWHAPGREGGGAPGQP